MTYSMFELGGSIFTVTVRALARLLTNRPTLIERECVVRALSFFIRNMFTAAVTTFLYGLIAAFIVLSQMPTPYAFETIVLPRLGGVFLQYVIPFAIANLTITKGVVAMTADIASMRVSQEIDAMESLGVHPIEMVFVPRALSLLLSAPALALLGVCGAFIGAWLCSLSVWQPTLLEFLDEFGASITSNALVLTLVKVSFTAFVMSVVGGYYGFNARRVERGLVGLTTTAAVGSSVLAIATINLLFNILGLGPGTEGP